MFMLYKAQQVSSGQTDRLEQHEQHRMATWLKLSSGHFNEGGGIRTNGNCLTKVANPAVGGFGLPGWRPAAVEPKVVA